MCEIDAVLALDSVANIGPKWTYGGSEHQLWVLEDLRCWEACCRISRGEAAEAGN